MAKLYLKFEETVLKEVTVTQGGTVNVGRLPDNMLQVDNLAVSGHHAKIYWEADHYVVEDNNSLNGTFVNNQRVSKAVLKDGDNILIGKHTITFKDEWHEDEEGARTPTQTMMPPVPKMEATMVLDTKKAKELLAQAKAMKEAAAAGAAPDAGAAAGAPVAAPPPPPKERTGVLTVIEGKTDEPRYLLSGKLTVIGKSAMATIKLKGSLFRQPPDVAAIVSKRDNKYFVAPQDKKAHLKLNGADVDHQQELNEGDTIEVFGVKMTFEYHD